jgi:hypothetical protein
VEEAITLDVENLPDLEENELANPWPEEIVEGESERLNPGCLLMVRNSIVDLLSLA